MRFHDKVAIVTGAASGIGRAIALRLAQEGATLALVDRNESGLAATVSALMEPGAAAGRQAGPQPWSRALDIADEQSVAEAVREVAESFGRIDVLCNNAGISGGDYSAVTENDLAIWHQVLNVNLFGAVNFTKHAARVMRERQDGAIVNTASVAGIRSGAGGNAYSASKAAVINLTMTSACDLGQWHIRVNAVCPGLIETGMTAGVFQRAREAGKEDRLGSRCELRRYGHPQEVASAVAFLASEDASYITGQALAVDGGNTASLNLPGMKV
ncbi:NAD(P)-dependent dehydrogenase, short-chain alcohol dehydrogenase family [Noviherbaspirillum humi]|uniref:NAD(P)-dependent dehydrogenase, short-chain alcohol dehydrogenase family n=1 Tax=Noviherbaspirillum humi TaxID=1688639 RepID=A0A239IU77_9BURK|nr:SDR family NAD(P)-dependent oxidoreductase [Noviherbaspirillum humi]SNS97180.1 NAD(P)-dependent dehydrogenase, short-chain alcohol dehydrogenase family [Noviherbaspirillum humi]